MTWKNFERRPVSKHRVETARKLRNESTPQEARLWLRLRAMRKQGAHFRRQVPIGRFIVDFACLRSRLVIEVDGSQHGIGLGPARDAKRDEALRADGFRVLRFWNTEIMNEMDMVLNTIFAELKLQGLNAPCLP